MPWESQLGQVDGRVDAPASKVDEVASHAAALGSKATALGYSAGEFMTALGGPAELADLHLAKKNVGIVTVASGKWTAVAAEMAGFGGHAAQLAGLVAALAAKLTALGNEVTAHLGQVEVGGRVIVDLGSLNSRLANLREEVASVEGMLRVVLQHLKAGAPMPAPAVAAALARARSCPGS